MTDLDEKVMLNKEKAERLLAPQRFPGRVHKVDRPNKRPGQCAITGRHSDRFFIDLGIDTNDFMGEIFICADIAEQIARMCGFIPPDAYREAYESNLELAQIATQLHEENKTLREVINGFDGLRHLSDADSVGEHLSSVVSSLPSEPASEDVDDAAGTGETEDTGSDKPGDEQRVGNLPDISFSSSPPGF